MQREQRVLLCCADTPAFLWWFWGAMWIGAIPVPLSTMFRTEDYRFLIGDSRAVGMIYSPPFAGEVLPATSDQPYLAWVLDDSDDAALGDPAEAGEPFRGNS